MRSPISTSINKNSGSEYDNLRSRNFCPGLGIEKYKKKRLDALTIQSWKHFFADNLKVGSELEVAVPRGSNREKFHSQLIQTLQPTKTYNVFGKYGVYGVEVEHCGMEIQVIGNAPYYPRLLRQYKKIIDVLYGFQARTKATCGLHFHFLCDSLIDPVPDIILSNLWNLTRFFAVELKYLTSAGERPRGICRRRNHNSHLEIAELEAGSQSLRSIQQQLRKSRRVPEHQNLFNLEHIVFNANEDITTFHYELRFPDIDLCATSIVTKIFLCTSLLFRAIDVSRFGIAVVKNQDIWEKKLSLLNRISNNDGTLAESDTRSLNDDDYQNLRTGTENMLKFLRPALLYFPDNPSLKILEFLMEHPISFLRNRGWSWANISAVLSFIGGTEHEKFFGS